MTYKQVKLKHLHYIHKALISIKLRKMSILALNDTVLCQNRLKMEFSNLSELQEGSFKTGLGI